MTEKLFLDLWYNLNSLKSRQVGASGRSRAYGLTV
jgi:hypothetical protein